MPWGIGMALLMGVMAWTGCAGCPRGSDDVISVTGNTVTLDLPPPPPPPPVPLATPPPPAVNKTATRTAVPTPDILSTLVKSGPPPVPPGAYMADDLTHRLKEKMAESYDGDLTKVPDAKIFLGTDTLDNFVKFYEQRGYKTSRVSIPANQIIQAATRDRPELANKISPGDYEGVVIEQVMIDGTGTSAADKYIDPDTFQVVHKLFITVMPLK